MGTPDADRWNRAVNFLEKVPRPVALLASSCPGAWAAMCADGSASDDGSEEAQEARMAVVIAAIRFEPRERGLDFRAYARSAVTRRVLTTRTRERLRRHDRLPAGLSCPQAGGLSGDDRIDFDSVASLLSDADRETLGRAFGVFGYEAETTAAWAARRGTHTMDMTRAVRRSIAAVRAQLDGGRWAAADGGAA